MNTLTFNEVDFNPVEQNGQIWLTSKEIAKALGYKNSTSINKLYNANADEFTDNMTQTTETVVSLKTKGLTVKTRIFSLRGCHALAFFARTVIAKQFRKWVLDILDREVSTRTDAKQREALVTACDKLAIGNTLRSDVYTMVANHFGYEKVTQIPAPLLPEAVAFVYDVILAKQKGGSQDSKYVNDMHSIGTKKAEETRHAINVLQKALASLDCSIEVIRQNNETQAGVFESLKRQTGRIVK